jgi:hypothetical protein
VIAPAADTGDEIVPPSRRASAEDVLGGKIQFGRLATAAAGGGRPGGVGLLRPDGLRGIGAIVPMGGTSSGGGGGRPEAPWRSGGGMGGGADAKLAEGERAAFEGRSLLGGIISPSLGSSSLPLTHLRDHRREQEQQQQQAEQQQAEHFRREGDASGSVAPQTMDNKENAAARMPPSHSPEDDEQDALVHGAGASAAAEPEPEESAAPNKRQRTDGGAGDGAGDSAAPS